MARWFPFGQGFASALRSSPSPSGAVEGETWCYREATNNRKLKWYREISSRANPASS